MRLLLICSLLLASLPAMAAEKYVVMHAIDEFGVGKIIGVVKLQDSDEGLVLEPDIGELPRGTHGFHVHEKPSCEAGVKDGRNQAGLAAGGHFDPAGSGKHEGPAGAGHKGDLPVMEVGSDGNAHFTLLAPKLTIADITGRSLVIHAGGDNFSDQPNPLGGGGLRIACGLIE